MFANVTFAEVNEGYPNAQRLFLILSTFKYGIERLPVLLATLLKLKKEKGKVQVKAVK